MSRKTPSRGTKYSRNTIPLSHDAADPERLPTRNSTSFPKLLYEAIRVMDVPDEWSFLKYYQTLVVHFYKHLMPRDTRGMLIYHDMGMGKSLLACALAMDNMDDYQPIMLMSKSLHNNMREAIIKYVQLRTTSEPNYYLGKLSPADLSEWIDVKFSFVSLNASNVVSQLDKVTSSEAEENLIESSMKGVVDKYPSLEGRHLIVDEAHNLFRAITNGSKNALKLYASIMKAKDIRITFLSGTPTASSAFEVVPCFNMLTGQEILPENYTDFMSTFVDKDKNSIRNKCKFQNRISGLVSYVSATSTPGEAFGKSTISRVEFPEERPLIVERCHMTQDQYVAYMLARDKEMEESSYLSSNVPTMTKPKSEVASTYRVYSRMLSNFCPPKGLENLDYTQLPAGSWDMPKYLKMIENIDKHPNRTHLIHSPFVGKGGLGPFTCKLREIGWSEFVPETVAKAELATDTSIMTSEIIEDITGGSDQLLSIIADVEGGADESQSIYDYLDNIRGKLNEHIGERSGGGKKNKVYALLTGEQTPEERSAILAVFTCKANLHAEIIDALLISDTGAEGLDAKGLALVHEMGPGFVYGITKQVFGRGSRNGSHSDMEAGEKWVQPVIYLAVPPKTELDNKDNPPPKTTDEELFEKAVADYELMGTFWVAMQEASIECAVNNGSNCRMCNPTGDRLFGDMGFDIAAPDPCSQLVEKTIELQPITYNGVKYYYNPSADALYDYDIYGLDENLGAYKKLSESNPIVEKIAAIL